MCRLYGMAATHPTRVECELVDAQNSLFHQSRRDARGLENPHGWGMAWFRAGQTRCRRQVRPADESEAYRRIAARTEGTVVVAHVRRATVGRPRLENTHPFRHGDSFLAHNGHIEHFDRVRPALLEEMAPLQRKAIAGTTDSEHFFQLALSLLDGDTPEAMRKALVEAIRCVRSHFPGREGEQSLALNTLFGHEGQLAGTRLHRSLWYLERERPGTCHVCGEPHHVVRDGDEAEEYRAVVVASERITDEDWKPVPNGSVFTIRRDPLRLEIESLPAP